MTWFKGGVVVEHLAKPSMDKHIFVCKYAWHHIYAQAICFLRTENDVCHDKKSAGKEEWRARQALTCND